MSVIKIEKNHQLTIIQLKNRIEQMAEQIGEEFAIKYEWEDSTCMLFRGKGINGDIEFNSQQLVFTMRLGMMWRVLRNAIESKVTQAIEQNLMH
ncbi:polyhydroxyalkanoic acid system family protein [Aliikangiella maris]|uniref:Polyhydroxyalkanoic acid system family protein n=2 Tax=Aliikangiella maris TaxID=3162458 RepID=A0ABV3MNZ0_9GAMM